MDTIMRALTYRGRNRWKKALLMFAASRAHSLAYGLTFREWCPAAWWNFYAYLQGRGDPPRAADKDEPSGGTKG